MPKLSSKTKRISKSHNLYLGVDGGGTKTHIVLIDDQKEEVCEGFSGVSNPMRVGVETAVANITKALDETCDRAQLSRSDIVSSVLGLAGVRRAEMRQRVRERFSNLSKIKQIEVITDAEIALYGTTLGKAGVVVIAGTGSISYGMDENGNVATAGGWGPLAGDEGGGSMIARKALQAIAKATDGRGKATKLTEAGMEYFRTSTPENLLSAIYAPQIDNARIAGFARYVADAARDGDEIATEILQDAGSELGFAVGAVLKKLKLENKKIPIGYVGGVFKAGKMLIDPLIKQVHAIAPKAVLAEPKLSPARAAAEMAFKNFGS